MTTADQLLRREGFDAFTMNKLAAAADLAKGTLYLYFATREELVLAIYTDLHDGWINRFIAAEKQKVTPDYADFAQRCGSHATHAHAHRHGHAIAYTVAMSCGLVSCHLFIRVAMHGCPIHTPIPLAPPLAARPRHATCPRIK